MSSARDEILQRVATALGAPPADEPVVREYRRSGALAHEECVALFCRRVGEYRADVQRVDARGLAALIAAVCSAHNARRLVVPAGLPPDWRSGEIEFLDDHELSPSELDAVDGALTGCTAAIAETGTLILAGGPLEGRRAITLVPDLHVCVVRESQIVELLPEALALLEADGLAGRPITFVSGPSATSDIELSRVEGVHGPRNLVVLVVGAAS